MLQYRMNWLIHLPQWWEKKLQKMWNPIITRVQADEANDVCKTEQLALVLRYYDEQLQGIQESLISFTNIVMKDATSVTDIILKSLEITGLDYKSSRVDLEYDGVSVMSGVMCDAQKCIHDKAPFACNVQFCGPRLNLVLINVTKCVPQAAEFFSLLEELYLFLASFVIHERFLCIQRDFFPEDQIREVHHLNDTWW